MRVRASPTQSGMGAVNGAMSNMFDVYGKENLLTTLSSANQTDQIFI